MEDEVLPALRDSSLLGGGDVERCDGEPAGDELP